MKSRSRHIPQHAEKLVYAAIAEQAGLMFDLDDGKCSKRYHTEKNKELNRLVEKVCETGSHESMNKLQRLVNEVQIARHNGDME